MTTDPISDMLTRIRNAAAAGHSSVRMPHSKIKEAIAGILTESKFVTGFKSEGEGALKQLEVQLKTKDGAPFISSLERISKPGRRIYAAASEIPIVLSGRGIVILSTSAGIMTGLQARRKGLGGELICKVW